MSDIRERILNQAVDLYLEKGLSGLSMRHVAEKVGVSATALYRHYRNKEDLLHNVIGEAVKVFGSYLFPTLAAKTPKDRFLQSGEAYLNFALETPKYYEVLFLTQDQLGHEFLPMELQEKSRATFQFLVDRVQECMDARYFRKGDANAFAFTIWGHSHGLVSIYLAKKSPYDEKTFRKVFWDSYENLYAGIGLKQKKSLKQSKKTNKARV